MLSWFQAGVLGVVQGLTEFLPVSSSAHLRVVAELFGWADPGASFTAVTQIGTEAAVLIYFRRDVVRIIRAWSLSIVRRELRSDPDARMGWYIILGSLPIGILGFAFRESIRGEVFRNLWLTAAMLVGFAVVLGAADRLGRRTKSLETLTLRDGLVFGAAQALALVPGVSRSGGTISAGMLLGYTREAAARYSFLLAIPAVMASGLLELTQIGDGDAPAWGPTVLATVIAFGVGYAAIAWFLRFVTTRSFLPFVVYRVVLGLAIAGLLAAGVLDADPTG